MNAQETVSIEIRDRKRIGRLADRAFSILGLFATAVGLVVLLVLLVDVFIDGFPRLGWDFLTSYPSRKPENVGILAAWAGTAWLMVLTALIAFPLGVASATYLEEYGRKGWFTGLIEI